MGTVLLGGAAALAWFLVAPAAAAPCGAAWLGLAAFFRDPHRDVPGGEGLLVAPADGKVVGVEEGDFEEAGRSLRISIFLSLFDVHVNRSPCEGTVEEVRRRPGGFMSAMNPKCSQRNESCSLRLRTPSGTLLVVRQIAGLVARRIVCPVEPGRRLGRGERYGMIKFGSRTEVYVPAGGEAQRFEAAVRPGDRVRGGETVLGRFTAS